eukprot:UN12078
MIIDCCDNYECQGEICNAIVLSRRGYWWADKKLAVMKVNI